MPFKRKLAANTSTQPRFFWDREVFSKYGHFEKRFVYDIQETGKNFYVFSSTYY